MLDLEKVKIVDSDHVEYEGKVYTSEEFNKFVDEEEKLLLNN